jgi:hypothetical protein
MSNSEHVTLSSVIKLWPVIFIHGVFVCLYQAFFASLVLNIGTQTYHWRSFSIFEVVIASAAFEIITTKIYQHEPEHPIRDLVVSMIIPPTVYLAVLFVSFFN